MIFIVPHERPTDQTFVFQQSCSSLIRSQSDGELTAAECLHGFIVLLRPLTSSSCAEAESDGGEGGGERVACRQTVELSCTLSLRQPLLTRL